MLWLFVALPACFGVLSTLPLAQEAVHPLAAAPVQAGLEAASSHGTRQEKKDLAWTVKKTLAGDEPEPDDTETTLDQTQVSWYEHYKGQRNAPDPSKMLLNTDPEPALDEGFEELFNGKDLSGWTKIGGHSTFEAKDGQIIGTCLPGASSTYLCTDREDYTNFVLTCRVRWAVDGNSGVMFRALTRQGKNGESAAVGPQAELEGFSKDRGWSGGIYGQGCGGFFYPLWLEQHQEARAALKQGEWNRLTIHAEGPVVKTWINGVPAAHWVDTEGYDQGFLGLQVHSGKEGTTVWEGLRVKHLPASESH